MSDPIWGPKGFWADKHAAEQGHTITPSGNPYSPGSFAGRQAKNLKHSGGEAPPASGSSSGTVVGDVVGGIVFLGGVAVSFMSMIQSQNPLALGGGLLLCSN